MGVKCWLARAGHAFAPADKIGDALGLAQGLVEVRVFGRSSRRMSFSVLALVCCTAAVTAPYSQTAREPSRLGCMCVPLFSRTQTNCSVHYQLYVATCQLCVCAFPSLFLRCLSARKVAVQESVI